MVFRMGQDGVYDEQDSRSRKDAPRILTDAWLLVSIRDIPGFCFNRYGCSGFVRPRRAWGYDTTFFNSNTVFTI